MEAIATRPRSSSLPPRLPSSFKVQKRRCPAQLISEEAQDLICSYVAGFQAKALPTLAAFARTTRSWTESGQRALFKAPLDSRWSLANWSRAKSLLDTLQSNPRFASYVRSLDDLTEYASRLEGRNTHVNKDHNHTYIANPKAFASTRLKYLDDFATSSDESEDETEALPSSKARSPSTWAWNMLRVCKFLVSASIPIKSEREAEQLDFRLSKKTHPRLSRVRLDSLSSYYVDGWMLKSFAETIGRRGPLKRFTLKGFAWDEDDGEEDPTYILDEEGLDMAFEELVLHDYDAPFPLVPFFFPSSRHPSLKTLFLSTFDQPDGEDFVHILEAAGQKLETFHFKGLTRVEDMSIGEYNDHVFEGTQLLASFFTSTPPTLRRLVLEACEDMESGDLITLAHSSPLLEQIDLTDTVWEFDESLHAALCGHWQEDIIDAVNSLPKLKMLHLGWLPLTLDDGLPIVEAGCTRAGVAVAWRCCCGGYFSGSPASEDDSDEVTDDDDEDRELRRRQRMWALEREMDDPSNPAYLGNGSEEDSWVDDDGDEVDDDDLPSVASVD